MSVRLDHASGEHRIFRPEAFVSNEENEQDDTDDDWHNNLPTIPGMILTSSINSDQEDDEGQDHESPSDEVDATQNLLCRESCAIYPRWRVVKDEHYHAGNGSPN